MTFRTEWGRGWVRATFRRESVALGRKQRVVLSNIQYGMCCAEWHSGRNEAEAEWERHSGESVALGRNERVVLSNIQYGMCCAEQHSGRNLLHWVGSKATEICWESAYHLIPLPLTHGVQLIEPVSCKLQVVMYKVILVECRLMHHACTQHLHRNQQICTSGDTLS